MPPFHGEIDLERGALPLDALHRDPPAVFLNNGLRNRQSQSRALRSRGEEGIKDAPKCVGIDALAGILDRDPHEAVLRTLARHRDAIRSTPSEPLAHVQAPAHNRDLDGQAPPIGHRVGPIAHQVRDDLLDLLRIDVDRRDDADAANLAAHPRLLEDGAIEFERLAHDRLDLTLAHARLSGTGESEQARDDPFEPLRLLQDQIGHAPIPLLLREAHLQHLGTVSNARQGIANLVRGAGGQLADHGESFAAARLLIERPLFGQIAQDADQTRHLAAGIADAIHAKGDGQVATLPIGDIELGLHKLVLLTNSPATRYVGLDAYGLTITGTRPITE